VAADARDCAANRLAPTEGDGWVDWSGLATLVVRQSADRLLRV